jgi:hypothetical protein
MKINLKRPTNKILAIISMLTMVISGVSNSKVYASTSNQTSVVSGIFNTTTIDVSVPAINSFTYNPNTNEFDTQNIEVINNTNAPVYVAVNDISVSPTSEWIPSLVSPTAYTDSGWNNLTSSQTKSNLALGISAISGSNWLSDIQSPNVWSSNINSSSVHIGAIRTKSSVLLTPTIKVGRAITNEKTLTANYIFEFGLEAGITLKTAPTGMQGYQVPKGTTGPTAMIDGDLSTNWNSGGYSGVAQVNFPTSQSISAIQLAVGSYPTTNEDYTIAGLQNGTWKQIGSSTQLATGGNVNILSPISVTPGHYDAIKISVNGRASWVCIVELTLIP